MIARGVIAQHMIAPLPNHTFTLIEEARKSEARGIRQGAAQRSS
jgi:hypothetical protein